jgi:hypothetical protein
MVGSDCPGEEYPQLAVSRRAVLSGAAVAATLALPSVALGQVAALQTPVLAIFDHSIPQGHAFARRAAERGIGSVDFTGDMSPLWFNSLLPTLRNRPLVLAGLTDADALFCFEQLAWDVGMRVRLRIDHQSTTRGFRHVASTELPSPALDRAGPGFGANALDAAIDCRAMWGDCPHGNVPAMAQATAPALVTPALVTWVIAPKLSS